MKKMCLMLCLCCLGAMLCAQTAWQQETVVRERYQLSDVSATCSTLQGEMFFLYLESGYESQSLYLQKFDNNGNTLWNEPRIVAPGMNSKSPYSVFASDDGSYFIIWEEDVPEQDDIMFLRKIDAQGNPLWQPENTQLDLGSFWGKQYILDGLGGLYLIYDKSITGENWNIWGQHINANGIQLLPNQGVEITANPLQENAAWCKAASNGTIMFGYGVYGGTFNNQHHILNLNPDFSINWSMDIDSGWTEQHSELSCNVLSSDDTVFFFTWKEMSPNATKLFLQRFDLQGNTDYPQPRLLADNPDNISLYSSAILTSDNNIMVSMHLGSNILPTQNYIAKVDALGYFAWEPATISLPDSIIGMSALAADAEGGAYFTFKYIPNNENYRVCSTLQHISSSGELQFPSLGVELTPQLASTYQYSPRISYLNGNIFTAWMSTYGTEYGFYYNVRNTDGVLIGADLRTIIKGIYGYGELRAIQARTDDVVVVWRDTRNEVTNSAPKQYWYQIVNADGTEELEQGGALLFDYGTASYTYLKTAYLQNGNTLVIYSYITNSCSYIGGQLILPDGSLPWGAAGRTFHEFPYIYHLSLADVYAIGDDVYLGWEMNYPGVVNPNRVQKITDGYVQWGEEGLAVNSGLPYTNMNEKLFAFRNGYACLLVQVSDPQRYLFWVTRLDATGALAADWLVDGVVTDTLLYMQDSYLSYAAAEYQDNLLVVNSHALDDLGRYHYTILDAGGHALVYDAVLFAEEYSQKYIAIDTTSGFGILAGLSDPSYYLAALRYNKLDAYGGFPWGEESVPITPWEVSYNPDMGRIHGFANGGYAVTYINANKLYCNYINPDGSYRLLFAGEPLSPKARNSHMGTVLNDELYLAWHDFKYTTATSSIGEIRMQKLLNTTVSVADDLLPQPQLTLSIYPNPFNPRTTIKFCLAEADIKLEIYNQKGQLVKCLTQGKVDSGFSSIIWNGTDSHNHKVASGLYYSKLSYNGKSVAKKMVLMK